MLPLRVWRGLFNEKTPPRKTPKLLDEVRRILRLKQYSIRTGQSYMDWMRRFIAHHRMRHPRGMGGVED